MRARMTHAFMNGRFFWSPAVRALWFNGPPETPGYTLFPSVGSLTTCGEITEWTQRSDRKKNSRKRAVGVIVEITFNRRSCGSAISRIKNWRVHLKLFDATTTLRLRKRGSFSTTKQKTVLPTQTNFSSIKFESKSLSFFLRRYKRQQTNDSNDGIIYDALQAIF